MNLIFSATMYQLFNAINMVENGLVEEGQSDLLLSWATDFSPIIDGLRGSRLFRKIYEVEGYLPAERHFKRELSTEEREQIWREPASFTQFPDFESHYQHLYTAVDDIYVKMLYYHLLQDNEHIDIHFYDEAIAQYFKDYGERATIGDHRPEYYGDRTFEKHIVEYYLYEPELYCGSPLNCPIPRLPKMTGENPARGFLRKLYKNWTVPMDELRGKHLFFVDAFIDKLAVVEDIRMLDYIASVTGKDDILIKMHPREGFDRFSGRGYTLMKNYGIPWEAQLLMGVPENMSVITVSSNAAMSAKLVYGLELYTVFLYQMPVVGASNLLKVMPKFKVFMKNMSGLCNTENGTTLFIPKSFEELRENMLYIGGMIHE